VQNTVEITQSDLLVKPWMKSAMRRLPGVQPLDIKDWILVDDAYARQMAYRDHLMTNKPEAVLATCSEASDAVAELLDVLLSHLNTVDGYEVQDKRMKRPDGEFVPTDHYGQMETIGRLLQQDFCVLNKTGDEHVLKAAALCFPASWRLDQKIGKPLGAIHSPVSSYDAVLARKVQKMLDLMRPEQALWRANCLIYSNPDLFQPQRRIDRPDLYGAQKWVRVERQTLRKLPQTGAVVFGIHTSQVRLDSLPEDAQKEVLGG